MVDTRPKSAMQRLLKTRRRVETVIGQLVEFFGFATCKARDLRHLTKLLRKLIAYNLAKVSQFERRVLIVSTEPMVHNSIP